MIGEIIGIDEFYGELKLTISVKDKTQPILACISKERGRKLEQYNEIYFSLDIVIDGIHEIGEVWVKI
jgi:hypothetical protein